MGVGVGGTVAGRFPAAGRASNFEDIINRNPERKYQIDVENFKIHAFWSGVTLRNVSIQPFIPDSTTTITGQITEVRIGDISWPSLVLNRSLEILNLEFVKPWFTITVVKDTSTIEDHPTVEMRQLFGDILTRGKIQAFLLNDGRITIKNAGEDRIHLAIYGFNIFADKIVTDSLQWQRVIPFHMDDLFISYDSLRHELNPHSQIVCGPLVYKEHQTTLRIERFSLQFTEEVQKISDHLGLQKDLITFSIDTLDIIGLAFFGDSINFSGLNINKIIVNGLSLHDYRDKNKPRPKEPVKPLFAGMIRKIPIPIEIDTIQLHAADIYYSEMPEGKDKFGTLGFNRTYASIYKLTNAQKNELDFGSCEIDVETQFNDRTLIKGHFIIPYEGEDQFVFSAALNSMPMEVLNSTLHPLASISINSGSIHKLNFSMATSNSHSDNQLTLDYENLNIEILNAQDKKSGFTWLANPLLRSVNLPEKKNYRIASYKAERNIYRGPFNFMWNSLKERMMVIIPSATAQKLVTGKEKPK